MNDPAQSMLNVAFVTRLEALDPVREQRLCAFDYRSRTRRRRLWAATGACGTTAIAVTSALIFTSGASVAYAGWSPRARTATPSALASATAACSAATTPATAVTPPARIPLTSEEAVLSETRGGYTAAIYDVSNSVYLCITNGGSITYIALVSPTTRGGGGLLPGDIGYVAPDADQLTFPNTRPWVPWQLLGANRTIIHALGSVGTDISTITLDFADGTTVDATIEDGWYFAWWPSGQAPMSFEITTTSGETIHSQWPCQAGSSSCAFVDQPYRLPDRSLAGLASVMMH